MEKVELLTFIIAFSINFWCLVAKDYLDPVLDITGQEVRTGVDYYILPAAASGNRSGLTLSGGPNGTFPPLVVLSLLSSSDGLPVQFSSVNPKDNTVQVSTDQNVKFSTRSRCGRSTVWKLNSKEIDGRYIVGTGGVEGNPGIDTLSNWFNVLRYGDAYKLVFCPTVCKFCRPVCGDLGIFAVAQYRFLAISDEPFKVVFKKA